MPLSASAQGQGVQLDQLLKTIQQGAAASSDQETPPPPSPRPRRQAEQPPVDLERPRIPLLGASPGLDVKLSQDGKVSIVAQNAPVGEVLELLSRTQGFNLVQSSASDGRDVTISLKEVTWEKALDAITAIAGLTWVQRDQIIMISSLDQSSAVLPQVQNREIRVFELDYASVEEVEVSVQGLLSPVGQVSIHQTAAEDVRQNKNMIVVEDLPAFIARIEDYIHQVDQAPRQVMIEARVLQIALTGNYLHGVNLLYQFAGPNGSTLSLSTRGFANALAPQALLFTLASDNLNAVIEALERTTDSKTLAAPRVLCVNGQQARVQVGGQLGFRVLTTTQTSTLEQIQFLNTGVILRITPYITRDNQVLMTVQPEVSTGQINAQGLPEAQTTTVQTQVLLPDGQGMVIGGLIQETYNDRQQKIPVIGDIRWVGRLFQRREVDRQRTEVIIALVPRIVPYDCPTAERDREELLRTDAPIFRGALGKNPRPWEPKLYDACENPRFPKNLIPWNDRMNPRDRRPTIPYPTDPASRACLDDSASMPGSCFDPEMSPDGEGEIPQQGILVPLTDPESSSSEVLIPQERDPSPPPPAESVPLTPSTDPSGWKSAK